MGEITYDYTGTLPPGLTLAGGLFSGTPTTSSATSTTITFIATDEDGNNEDLVVTLPQVDSSGGGLTWNTTAAEFSSLTLTEGTPMSSITLSATGVGTISYADDAMLPAGISLTAGVVSGTPTTSTATETTVTFTAQDDNGDSETLTVSFPMINASSGGSVTWITLDTDFPSILTVDDPISSISLSATGTGTITYDYNGTLPPGLTLTAGILSGTPTTQSATSTTITFTATDMDSNTEDLVVTLPQVEARSGGVTWNKTAADFSALTLTEGTPMSSITLSATGVGTISYADDAMLPAGISLTAGVVSGTPTTSTATETTVTFTAQDDNGDSETLTVSFPMINASGGISNPTWVSDCLLYTSPSPRDS